MKEEEKMQTLKWSLRHLRHYRQQLSSKKKGERQWAIIWISNELSEYMQNYPEDFKEEAECIFNMAVHTSPKRENLSKFKKKFDKFLERIAEAVNSWS